MTADFLWESNQPIKQLEGMPMVRFRVLFLLLALILLSQTPQTVLAAPKAPTPPWKAGTYKGTITIKAKDHHSTPKEVEGKEEYTFHIPETKGDLQINIGSTGNIQFQFSIPISFSNADWAESPDDGQGNCRGMVSDTTGRGRLTYNGPPSMVPVGEYFSTTRTPKFTLYGTQSTVFHLGSNCDKTSADDIRKGISDGLKSVLQNQIDFMIEHKTTAGMCTMFAWENDPERSYTCSWKVHLVTKKK
jgi:hypothetical protein